MKNTIICLIIFVLCLQYPSIVIALLSAFALIICLAVINVIDINLQINNEK